VHAFTASSAAVGVLAVFASERGDAQTAFALMALTVAVDAVDGTLARAVGVKQVLPYFDGTRLDDIVDYFTWAVVPAIFLVHARLLPPGIAVPVALCLVLASAYQFCRTDAKTTGEGGDYFFTGFPSYWNIVAFYLYALGWRPGTNAAIVIAFTIAVFVPIRYLYPSRMTTLRWLTIALGCVWGAAVLWVLAHLDAPPRALVVASLAYPVYYVGLSLALQASRAAR
jgi:phosphatidylcholine synthase